MQYITFHLRDAEGKACTVGAEMCQRPQRDEVLTFLDYPHIDPKTRWAVYRVEVGVNRVGNETVNVHLSKIAYEVM